MINNQFNIGACLTNIGLLYKKLGDYSKSWHAHNRAYDVFSSFLPEGHVSVKRALADVARLAAFI
jgi:hypothetical protein